MNIIPKPNQITIKEGYFTLISATVVSYAKELESTYLYFKSLVRDLLGYELKVEGSSNITFKLDSKLKEEAYKLEINQRKIIITASCNKGAFYAIQSLRLLANLDTVEEKEVMIRCCVIEDSPRFRWRGLMLDESRHFFGKAEVKRILDHMSLNKLNVFHWHLTDDQGWRIEIKNYPKLIEIGSKRKGSHVHGWSSYSMKRDVIWEPYDGHYTQEDVKEIVAYAKSLHIEIVPEIDMPAHFAAAMASYNYLACREISCEVPFYFGGKFPLVNRLKDWNRSCCVGKESTYQFIYDIIDELVELFPFPYFHIGGDEAPKQEWKKCSYCKNVIEKNNLNDVNELQAHFNNRIAQYLKDKSKRLIGWNEILEGKNIDKSIIAQYWTHKRDVNAEEFINSGGELIMSRHTAFYFDMSYAQVPLQNTYNFNPIHEGIKKESEKRILGVEGALWTEWIESRSKLDLNLFPRLQALSETAWTNDNNKDFSDFLNRLNDYKPLLKKHNVNYAYNQIAIRKKSLSKLLDVKRWYKNDQHFELSRNTELKKKAGEIIW